MGIKEIGILLLIQKDFEEWNCYTYFERIPYTPIKRAFERRNEYIFDILKKRILSLLLHCKSSMQSKQ